MLRINLLPSYVPQRRLTRKLILGFGALLVLCALIPLFLYFQAAQQRSSWESQATAAEAEKAKTDNLRQQTTTTTSEIAPIQAKVDFVKAVHQHNTDIVNFWHTVAAYSDPKVIYSDAVVSGSTLTIKAYTPSIAEVGRYLQAMYQEPDFQSVAIDKLPGYPEAVVSKVYYGNRLIAISGSGSSSAPGGGGRPSFGGGPGGAGGFQGGGMPGGRGGGFAGYGGGGGMGGGGFGGSSGTNGPTYGSSVALGAGGVGSNVPQIGAAKGVSGSAQTSDQIDPQQLVQLLLAGRGVQNVVQNPFARPQAQLQAVSSIFANLRKKIQIRREPQGFPVTVTATLKQPLTIPAVPGAAATTTGPGGGIPGGPPGGYPGGPGGPPGGYPGGPPAGYPGGPAGAVPPMGRAAAPPAR